jgi:hypothetical protein
MGQRGGGTVRRAYLEPWSTGLRTLCGVTYLTPRRVDFVTFAGAPLSL